MDNNKTIEHTENYGERIKHLFKVTSATEVYDTWGDTFDIAIPDATSVTITYYGIKPIKAFKKDCERELCYCIATIMGRNTKITFSHKGNLTPAKKNVRAAKFFAIGIFFVCIALTVVMVLGNYIGNRQFRETFYSTSSIKVDSRVRVLQLSDLHGASYGADNKDLLERAAALKPDIILCTGDIVDSAKEDVDYAVNLGKQLAEIAPTYYIYGNNEVETIYDFPLNEKDLDEKFGFTAETRDETALLELEDTFEEQLEAVGVNVLKNEMDTITVKTMTVDIYGVLTSNPSSFWTYTAHSFSDYIYNNPEHLKITAIHEPYIFQEFEPEFWGDLMVCGHTHGGVMRVPFLGPLYTEEGGLFPERNGHYVYGRYDTAGNPLIVSGGLENQNILRINNQPELVIIDINKF